MDLLIANLKKSKPLVRFQQDLLVDLQEWGYRKLMRLTHPKLKENKKCWNWIPKIVKYQIFCKSNLRNLQALVHNLMKLRPQSDSYKKLSRRVLSKLLILQGPEMLKKWNLVKTYHHFWKIIQKHDLLKFKVIKLLTKMNRSFRQEMTPIWQFLI